MATNNTANNGFEKQIWDAACVLRGNMDASEYKNVVLGLIFLKYISLMLHSRAKSEFVSLGLLNSFSIRLIAGASLLTEVLSSNIR